MLLGQVCTLAVQSLITVTMLLYLQVLVIFQYEVLELSFMGTSALDASRADAMGKYEQVKKVIDLEKNQIVMTRQSPM